jgi:uncharacterized HAD superfamily protein
VKILRKAGKDISIVTARSDKEKWKVDRTILWVRSHFAFLGDTNIHFVNHSTNDARPKSHVCKKVGITLMIDDAFENAYELSHEGIACILLEKPWNRNADRDHSLIYRAKNWQEIIDSLQK